MARTGNVEQIIFNTALTANDATAKEDLGIIRTEIDGTEGLKRYMYVKATAALAVGDVVVTTGETGYQVGPSTVAGTAGTLKPAGVALGTITANYYGWIQVKGQCNSILKTSNACVTAHGPTVLVSGKIQGRYGNVWSGSALIFDSTANTAPMLIGIRPHASLSNTVASVSGYIDL